MTKTIETKSELISHNETILQTIENVFWKVGFSELTVSFSFIRDVIIGEINEIEGLNQKDFYEIFDGVCEKLGGDYLK